MLIFLYIFYCRFFTSPSYSLLPFTISLPIQDDQGQLCKAAAIITYLRNHILDAAKVVDILGNKVSL